MYFRVEPSGCSVIQGLVQVRYSLYLDPGDYNYEKCYGKSPIIPPEGIPTNLEPIKLKEWFNSLPRKLENRPFHNHFCQFEPNVTDEEILFVGELALQMAKEKWENNQLMNVLNIPVQEDLSPLKNMRCVLRLKKIQETVLERR